VLDSADLAGGFEFGGERIPLINPQRGIFKPRQMSHLLSIKTVFPRKGARVWYDDQREVHHQIYAGDNVVDYQFITDPNSADNRLLLDAMEQQIPVIYFLGTSSGRYQREVAKALGVAVSTPREALQLWQRQRAA
jgi:putative restriction endonuclease